MIGIIGGCIGILIGCAWKKISWRKFFDMTAPGVLLAQAIGRWGNFMNREAFGAETDLPWRMRLWITVFPIFLFLWTSF